MGNSFVGEAKNGVDEQSRFIAVALCACAKVPSITYSIFHLLKVHSDGAMGFITVNISYQV
jgi:hypothetical protein